MTEQPDGLDAAIGTDPAVDQSGEGAVADAGPNESYHGYSVDDEDQPQDTGDSLVDDRGLAEPLDEGYSPPEKWSAGQKWGNTPLEEELGETLDMRLEQEVPEPDPYEQAAQEDVNALVREDTEGLPREESGVDPTDDRPLGGMSAPDTVGDERAGRLVEPDEGAHTDTEKDAVAEDVGIDGAGAGAEEAAVHVVDEDDLP